MILNLLALFFLGSLASSQAGAAADDAIPTNGLKLRLAADTGVELDNGRVISWADQSDSQFTAKTPDGTHPPAYDPKAPAVTFTNGTGLKIDGPVVSPQTREVTIMALARANAPMSIGILSMRSEVAPLLQLDVDEQANTRLIVRDSKGQTINAKAMGRLGKFAVYHGAVSLVGEDGTSRAEVRVGSKEPAIATGAISPNIFSGDTWIGMLRVPGRADFSWDGQISEILVYERLLSQEETERISSYLLEKYDTSATAGPIADDSWDVLNWAKDREPVSRELETDVCIIGAGSGGVGAAVAASREGADVILVERQARIGGTGVNALVSGWEPGPGCSIARELYERMRKIPGGTGIGSRYPNESTGFPMGQYYVTEGVPYEKSTRRAGLPNADFHDVPYSPAAFDRAARELLEDIGRTTLLDETTFFKAEAEQTENGGQRIAAVLLEDQQGHVTRVKAKVFIDCTGDLFLARDLGCETLLGIDPRGRFNEPSAPEEGRLQLNAISRCYQVRPSDNPTIEPKPVGPTPYFAKYAHVTGWKDGLRVVNPLPILPGRALIDLGYDECLRRSEAGARAHWQWLQQQKDFEGYELDYIAPMLGVRESYRVVARYMLCEDDLRKTLAEQTHDDIIAVADHPCDIHGAGGGLTHVRSAYGIPYRCLLPRSDFENLLVASRGAGMSRIAASSCRLQRTIIQLGHAAGKAAAWAARDGVAVDRIDAKRLAEELDARSRYKGVGSL